MRSIAMETRSWLEPAVELRLGKICRRLPQDLVRLAQLTVLTLERLDPLALFGCRTRSKTLVTFGLPHELHRVSRRPFCLRPTQQCRSTQAGHNRWPRPRPEGGFRWARGGGGC